MEIYTKRELIRNVAKRWRNQYEPFKDDRPLFSWRNGITAKPLSTKQIAEKLDALDVETATADDVNKIIGNESWTRMECNECGKDVDAVIQVGEPQDYESRTANLCVDCLKKACEMFCGEG